MSPNSILFMGQLLVIPYSYKLSGLMSIPSIVMSVISLPFVARYIKASQLSLLAAIYGTAIVTTAIALSRFPDSAIECAKCLTSYGCALFCGYVYFLTVTSLSRQQIANVCLVVMFLFLTFSTAEILRKDVRNLSERLSLVQTSVTAEWLEGHRMRDEQKHGGLLRPLCGTQEPSRVALVLAICITGWNLTRNISAESNLMLVVLTGLAVAITRSPTLFVALMAGNFLYGIREIASRNVMGLLMGVSLVGILAGGVILIRDRVEQISRGEDLSFNERIRIPINFCYVSLRETQGMGIGFIGAASERGNHALDKFFPYVVEAVRLSNANQLLKYYEHMDFKIHATHAPLFSHWIYHGIPCGILSIILWFYFTRSISPGLAFPFLISFLFLGLCAGGYETVMLWTCQLLVFGFIVQDAHHRHEQQEFLGA